MSWTEERVALLKQLWCEGKTAAEIAKVLGSGVTRNAVIGKAHRLKLSSRLSPLQPTPAPASNNNAKRPVREEAPRRVIVEDHFVSGQGVSMADLKDRMCRWPHGDPREPNFHFCGASALSGLPYCDHHARMAYQAASRPTRAPVEEHVEEADFDVKTVVNG